MKLEIKEPCHENWDNMKIGLISRHCDVCVKSVMDFTQMNRAQIITYILSNPSEQVCGRMNKDQFDFQHEDIPILIEELKKGKASNPFLILALVCLSLSACAQDKNGNIQTPPPIEVVQGQVEHNPSDSTETTTTNKPPRNNQIRKGKVACEVIEVVELGEIEPVDLGRIEAPVAGGIGIIEQPIEHPVEDKVYQFAEEMPEFKGGMDKLFDFVNKNLSYPRYEQDKNISGNVYVRFVVEKDGSITRPEIMRSVVGSKNFDAEVLRIIRMMPKWTPGENHGNKVPVYMSLPIQFRLK